MTGINPVTVSAAAPEEVLRSPSNDAIPLQDLAFPVPRGGLWQRFVHACAHTAANLVVHKPASMKLRFGLVNDTKQLAALGQMRLKWYQAKLPYLLPEFSTNGLDAYDAHSFLFAAWAGDQVVATIRATPYPYETLKYVPETEMSTWLGEGWRTHYLEWGRLLAVSPEGVNRVTPALITYAGLYLFGLTSYGRYFGYTRPKVKKSFGLFLMEENTLQFTIPHRGEHSYLLIKGAFLKGVLFAVPRWLGALARKIMAAVFGTNASSP